MLKSALVVDQAELQCCSLVRMLAQIGVAEVDAAHDGASALASIRRRQWDLVIVDLDMADRTGLQMIDALAEVGGCGGIAIASNYPSRILQAAATYARDRGVPIIAALGKPLQAARLISTIESRPGAVFADEPAVIRVATQGHGDMRSGLSRPRLRAALARREIVAYFQPQHCASTGELRGAEMLARWIRSEGVAVSPAAFLPAFESAALLEPFTDYMLERAFEAQSVLGNRPDRIISINVPAAVASSISWAQDVADRAVHASVDPARIVIEITEDGGARSNGALAGAITQLRLRGFSCAIDDFGTGDSSLDRLLCAPFDELKIDRGLIASAGRLGYAQSILACTVEMARSLDMTVVAEGIETREEHEMVRALGVHVTQGYYHGRPMPLDAFGQYAQSQDAIGHGSLTQCANA
ncbi:EAL domain-containing response regulator [Achromobacter aegrifaciens]|uniref:EAL domain-containing response regulator n=1 Tax=Achromobacter aegrifaciens TaxID=1287736 RepID=UPI000F73544D|nr:EAL domain-containing response regulator [Achromobacter aegrifaciens]RSF03253.1 EAL domain-containing protein [Achromobacter aegrifaciens]